MGLTFAGNVHIGNPLIPFATSLGNVIAILEANIGRTLLENWVDLVKLQMEHPTRVVMDSSMVTLQGPVAIIKSFVALRVAIVGVTTLGVAYLFYELTSSALKFLKDKQYRQFADLNSERIHKISIVVASIVCPILISATFLATGLLPFNEPGIYFL